MNELKAAFHATGRDNQTISRKILEVPATRAVKQPFVFLMNLSFVGGFKPSRAP
jgi:hypothetical protein